MPEESHLSKRLGPLTALFVLALCPSAFAQEAPPLRSTLPQSGFFVGVGGSYDWASVDQDLKGIGLSDVLLGSSVIASGSAGGPAAAFDSDGSHFAPDAQLGYFRHFTGSDRLAGLKFSYKYLDLTSADKNGDIPQAGSFTTTIGKRRTIPFKGDVTIASSQISIDHQLALMPFIGRSFDRS